MTHHILGDKHVSTRRLFTSRPTIHNLKELCEAVVGDSCFAALQDEIFENLTRCGAYIEPFWSRKEGPHEIARVEIGCILHCLRCDGEAFETKKQALLYPFPLSKFWTALCRVEIEAEELWATTQGVNTEEKKEENI